MNAIHKKKKNKQNENKNTRTRKTKKIVRKTRKSIEKAACGHIEFPTAANISKTIPLTPDPPRTIVEFFRG